MSKSIEKYIGEGFGKGELYAALDYDPNDAFGGYRIGRIYCEKTATTTDPDRLIQGYYTSFTTIADGKQLQGMQIRATFAGTATSAGGITGAEIKARAESNSITATLGQARAVVGNVDAKKATFTTAHVFEGQVDVAAGGTITTLKNFRASLNNSGTIGTSYAFIVETANTSLNWDYGLYMADDQADVGIHLGNCTTTATTMTQSMAVTDALGNGRRNYWQFSATDIEAGEHLCGLQLRCNWNCNTARTTSGITGIEIKARAESGKTGQLGTAKAIIGNVDVKKATFDTAWGFESQFDIESGGTITLGAAFRASLNNSGTFSTSYAYLVETANTSLNWDYGFYCTDGQADTGVAIGACSTANIAISGANATGIVFTGTYSVAGISITSTFTATGDYGILIADTYTLASAGVHRGIYSTVTYLPTTSNGVGTVYGIQGTAEVGTGKTQNEGSYAQVAGVRGHLEVTGTLSGAGVWASGVLGSVGPSAPTGLTTFKYLSCFTAMTLYQTDPLTGYYTGFLVANAGGYRYDYSFLALEATRYGIGIRPNKADSVLESAVIVDATNVSMAYNVIELIDTTSINYFLKSGTAGGCVAANTNNLSTDTLQHVIIVNIDGDTGYIPVLTSAP